MPINLKTHIQMQSKIMKKRQRKKNNKNVFIPLIPVEMTEEEVKQILKTREGDKSEDRRNMLSIPLSEVHAIRYRSPHNPLKKSIFF